MTIHVPGIEPQFSLSRFRQSLADEIERMIAVLDAIDGDPDIEDGGDDEPSLGAIERHPNPYSERSGDQLGWAGSMFAGNWDELEEENEYGGDILDEPHDPENGDEEPWLGWAEDRIDQSRPYANADVEWTERERDLAEDVR